MTMKHNQLIVIHNADLEDYWKLSNEDIKVEYSKGRLFIHTSASIKHEEIFGILYLSINNFLKIENKSTMLGSRVAVKLPDGHRPEPDLLYIDKDQYDRNKDIILDNIPRWIIEIISPSTRSHDMIEKLDWYRESKVEEIWLIDPANQELIIHKLTGKDYITKKMKKGKITPLDLVGYSFEVSTLWI